MKKVVAVILTVGSISFPTAAIAHPLRVDYGVVPLDCGGYLVVNAETAYVHHETNCLG